MTDALEKAKQNLESEKEKIRLKEKLLRERERKQRARKFQEIGRLAYKADIDQIDTDVLFGAFLELRERKDNKQDVGRWKERAESLRHQQDESGKTPLIVSFSDDPPKEVKRRLSELNFKWNSFRKEYYGHGKQEQLAKILGDIKHELEVVR